MFEQTSRLAEKLAASVSRRGFLGSLGGWAAAAAMGVAGVLASGGNGLAHPPNCEGKCCTYHGLNCFAHIAPPGGNCKTCPPSLNGCPFAFCGNNEVVGSEGFCAC
jgi:hypothetical protein